MNKSMQGSAKVVLFSIIVVLLGAGAAGVYLWQQQTGELERQVSELRKQNSAKSDQDQTPSVVQKDSTLYTSKKGVKIYVYNPAKNTEVSSGVWVVGMVPGSWSFEASFPVRIENSVSDTVVQSNAELLDDWTTEQLVPFKAKLDWSTDQSGTGNLILEKDNPSGLAENDDSVTIPVKF